MHDVIKKAIMPMTQCCSMGIDFRCLTIIMTRIMGRTAMSGILDRVSNADVTPIRQRALILLESQYDSIAINVAIRNGVDPTSQL